MVLDESLVMLGNGFQKRVCLMTMVWFELEVVRPSTIGHLLGGNCRFRIVVGLARMADRQQMLVSLWSTS